MTVALTDSGRGRVGAVTSLFAFVQAATLGAGFLLQLALARYLDSQDYTRFILCHCTILIGVVGLGSGLPRYLQRLVSVDPLNIRAILGQLAPAHALLTTAGSALGCAGAMIYGARVGDEVLAYALAASFAEILIRAALLEPLLWTLNAVSAYRSQALVLLLHVALRVLAAVSAAAAGGGILWILGATAAAALAASVIATALLLRAAGRQEPRTGRPVPREARFLIEWAGLASLADVLNALAVPLLLYWARGIGSPPEEVARFVRCYVICAPSANIAVVLMQAMSTRVARLQQTARYEMLRRELAIALALIAAYVVGGALVLAIIGEPLLDTLFGTANTGAESFGAHGVRARWLLPVTWIGISLMGGVSALNQLSGAMGSIRGRLLQSAMALSLEACLLMAFSRVYGASGAPMAMAVAAVIGFAASALWLTKSTSLRAAAVAGA